ncbi:MAG: hypothetical protein NZ581_06665 [Candidatus Caldarchaeum sp.]|nr:hypothetical protein [Candidatus Caldarchaeum sp.]MDW8435860.1 hypothetical protein [Candidatus Caldarchaeum sp.]
MVHIGRIVGLAMGLVILFSIVFLPFDTNPPTTFLEIGLPLVENIGIIPNLGDPAIVSLAYALVVSFILLVAAGIVGVFPLGAGVLGLSGMAIVTAAVYLFFPPEIPAPVWGTGYYAMWGASVIALGASFLRKKPKQPAQPPAATQTAEPPPETYVCSRCRETNPAAAELCVKCGEPLTHAQNP